MFMAKSSKAFWPERMRAQSLLVRTHEAIANGIPTRAPDTGVSEGISMAHPRWVARFVLALLLCATWKVNIPAADENDPAQIEFFESKIRPVLVDHCYECHSQDADKVKGGLLLDTKEGLLKGGDSGPAIVPGDPEKSLLIKAVRYTDEDLQMPPKNRKLASEQIADLEAWVKMGAPDTRLSKPVAILKSDEDREKAKKHWAFQPIVQPPVPRLSQLARWVQTPIDAFILAKLQEKGMTPSLPADKRTLLRRATFDLIGLPPTVEELDAFLADDSPGAFEKVVDRLLESRQYGERWGRYWLDVARYANTKGDVGNNERRYPFSYTYRDYVIEAFNDDKPFDRFVLEQIAADLLPPSGASGASSKPSNPPLAALGFLTLGPRFGNNIHEIIDDRIDVVTRGLMGLSVSCARCHDHKFDPIPTKDYYSLHGVFASCSEPADAPLIVDGKAEESEEYFKERQALIKAANDFREGKEEEARIRIRQQTADYLWLSYATRKISDPAERTAMVHGQRLSTQILQRWQVALNRWERNRNPVFAAWFAFAAIPEGDFPNQARGVAEKVFANAIPKRPVNPLIAQAFKVPPSSMKQVAERYATALLDVDARWQAHLAAHEKRSRTAAGSPRPAGLSDADEEALRLVFYAPDAPPNLNSQQVDRFIDNDSKNRERALRRRVVDLNITHPGSPARATVLVDLPRPRNSRVYVRGNPSTPGAEVPRQFLEIAAGTERKPFQKGSGRLELAQAIVSRENPLTARVIVNRIWLHHFGEGLVRTPSDFGLRSEPPSHPELLDYLAARFMDEGWSIKKMHKWLMLSSTYQQSSQDKPRYLKLDPANLWLWKMNRRRIDFEVLRDSLLAVGGSLDLTPGGQPVDLTTEPYPTRRTIYGYIDRQNLPGLFRTFDFANPDSSTPQRYHTTVPQQALFMMNSPLVVEQARKLVERQSFVDLNTDEERVRHLYRVVYQREPQPIEIKLAQNFLSQRDGAARSESFESDRRPNETAWQYGYGSYDPVKKRTRQFEPLPHFSGAAWQIAPKLPHRKFGWLQLTPNGGCPGATGESAVIRRWTAPEDGVIQVQATLIHNTSQGDGVQARIVSSRLGELGRWIAHKKQAPTPLARVAVKRGDTIDFLVEARSNALHDNFIWAPVIKLFAAEPNENAMRDAGMNMSPSAMTMNDTAKPRRQWDAQSEFRAPPKSARATTLNAWEKYAHVLLLANEFAFVN
jgi:hypothetical protein